MNHVVVDCHNQKNINEKISLAFREDFNIKDIEFVLKKKLGVAPNKHIKIFIYKEINNKNCNITDFYSDKNITIYYYIEDSPVQIRPGVFETMFLNTFLCGSNRRK